MSNADANSTYSVNSLITGEILADIVGWDVANWSRSVFYWNSVLPPALGDHLALELGAGKGGLSIFLARKGYEVICTDLEDPAQLASPLHLSYDLTDKISYRAVDATAIDFPDCTFDVVAFKSLLGGIGRNDNQALQQRAILEMHRVLKPGGYLLFAENLKGSTLHRYLRRKFVSWGSNWRYVTIKELTHFLRPFSRLELHTFGFFAAIGRSESQRHLLHYCDKLVDPLLPPSMNYIIYGSARK